MENKNIPSLESLLTEKESGISYNIDKITDNIYLGKVDDELNINQKILPIDDLYSENIIKYFKECIEFIDNNGKIFIHCECGVSRSATIVIAYLMWKTHSTFEAVYSFVKKTRPEIDPNNGFRRQLKKFQQLLEENNYDLNRINSELK